jgi:hypothetical protein
MSKLATVGCPILPVGLHRSAKRHAAFAGMALSPHLPKPPGGMPGLGHPGL